MKWYTLENGRLCLGTDKQKLANFHIATDVKLSSSVVTPLIAEHIDLIGSYPEDWFADDNIENKINATARHFFGMTVNSPNSIFA